MKICFENITHSPSQSFNKNDTESAIKPKQRQTSTRSESLPQLVHASTINNSYKEKLFPHRRFSSKHPILENFHTQKNKTINLIRKNKFQYVPERVFQKESVSHSRFACKAHHIEMRRIKCTKPLCHKHFKVSERLLLWLSELVAFCLHSWIGSPMK